VFKISVMEYAIAYNGPSV